MYTYNIPTPYNFPTNTYSYNTNTKGKNNDDRFVGPFLGPLLLGGIAGYALRPPYPAPYPVPAYPYQPPIYIPYNNPNTTYTSNSYYY